MDKNDIETMIGYMPMPASFPYRSIFLKGRPHHEKYDDFWRRPPPMDPVHRAKIFAPFDALAGFSDCIASKEIQYCNQRDLSEGEREELDRKLNILQQLTCNGKEARKNRPQVTIQFFSGCRDEHSSAYGTGGTYETITGTCRKIDSVSKTIRVDETIISIEDISDISGDLFETLDDAIP